MPRFSRSMGSDDATANPKINLLEWDTMDRRRSPRRVRAVGSGQLCDCPTICRLPDAASRISVQLSGGLRVPEEAQVPPNTPFPPTAIGARILAILGRFGSASAAGDGQGVG